MTPLTNSINDRLPTMKNRSLLPICLLPFISYAYADDIDALASQRDQLRQEVEQIQQSTRENRDRLDALTRMIEAARAQNSQLDQQLNQSLEGAAGQYETGTTPPPGTQEQSAD